MANEWFYQKDGQEIGPVQPVDLRRLAASGELKPTDPVRKADMDRWAKASALKGLFPAASPVPAAPPIDPPTPTAPPVPKPQPPAVKLPPPRPLPTKAAPNAPIPEVITETEPDEEPAPAPAPVKKSSRRWIWYAAAAFVLIGGAGAFFLYTQYQNNQTMSYGATTSIPPHPAGPTTAAKPTNQMLDEIVSENPFTRVAGFRRVLEAKKPFLAENSDAVHTAACDTLADDHQTPSWPFALRVLGRIGTPADMKLITPMTTTGGPDAQTAAIAASMLITPDEGVKLFEPHAGDTAYSRVMNDVIQGGSRREPALLAMLKSNTRVCRSTALAMLGLHGSAKAIEPIKKAKETEIDPTLIPAYQSALDGISARMPRH